MHTLLQHIETLTDIARRHGLESSRKTGEGLEAELRSLEKRPIVMSFVGEFSSGKSSLANALIGQPLLPVGLPETTITTNILHVGKFEGRLDEPVFRTGKFYEVDSRYVLPGSLIVDTPGFSSVLEVYDRIAATVMQASDVLFICVDAKQGPTDALLSFLKSAKTRAFERVLVLTKSDLLSDQELQEQTRSALQLAAQHNIQKVIRTSVVKPDGMAEFLSYLNETLYPRAAEIHRKSLVTKLHSVATQMLDSLSASRDSLYSAIETLDQQISETASEVEKLRLELRKRKTRAMSALRQYLNDLVSDLENSVENLAHDFAEKISKNKATSREFFKQIEAMLLSARERLETKIEQEIGEVFMVKSPDVPFSPPLAERVRKYAELAVIVGTALVGPLRGLGNLIEIAVAKVLTIFASESGVFVGLYRDHLLREATKAVDAFRENAEDGLAALGEKIEELLETQVFPSLREKKEALEALKSERQKTYFDIKAHEKVLVSDLEMVKKVLSSLEEAL